MFVLGLSEILENKDPRCDDLSSSSPLRIDLSDLVEVKPQRKKLNRVLPVS